MFVYLRTWIISDPKEGYSDKYNRSVENNKLKPDERSKLPALSLNSRFSPPLHLLAQSWTSLNCEVVSGESV